MERLTIDEAIAHARVVAEKNRNNCERNTIIIPNRYISNIDCAEEHEQLAEWLEELKAYKATNLSPEQIIDIDEAYTEMARYLEQDLGCCPVNYDNDFHKEKCRTCLQECLYNQNRDYNKELAVECWKEAFMEMEGE